MKGNPGLRGAEVHRQTRRVAGRIGRAAMSGPGHATPEPAPPKSSGKAIEPAGRSAHLYARLGYPETGRFKDFYSPGDDLIVFFKVL